VKPSALKLQFHCSQSSLWACRVLCQHEK